MSTLPWGVTSLRHPDYMEKQGEKAVQLLLEGTVHILTDSQSFQRCILIIPGGLIAYMQFPVYMIALVTETLPCVRLERLCRTSSGCRSRSGWPSICSVIALVQTVCFQNFTITVPHMGERVPAEHHEDRMTPEIPECPHNL